MWAEKWGSLWPCIITSWSRMTLKTLFVFWILSALLGCSTVEEIATVCCVWGVFTLDKDPLNLAVTPLFWKKKKKLNRLECPSKREGRLEIFQKYLQWGLTLGYLESASFALDLQHIQACGTKLFVARVRYTAWNTETLSGGWSFG